MNPTQPATPASEPDRRRTEITPVVERRVPVWIQRMQQQGLPAKDLTGRAA